MKLDRPRLARGSRPILVGPVAALLAAFLGLSACNRQPAPPLAAAPPEVPLAELKLTNGQLFQVGHTSPFTGQMLESYAGGQAKSRSAISNGVMWGLSEGWHTNGQLQVREHFRSGVSDGLRTKWDTNGLKLSEAQIVAGQLNGLFLRWHPNGVLAEQVEMKHGQPDGLARSWHPSGSLKSEVRMAAGKVVEQRSWSDGEANEPTLARGKTP